MMADLGIAEIRAEGRRLLADLAAARETIDGDRVEDAKEAWVNFTYQHHDVLLADPPPVGLTEKQITAIRLARKALLLGDELDLDERWFVVGSIDDAFPLIEASPPVSASVDPEEKP